MKNIGRRTFFNQVSIGAIGSMLLSFIPFNLFAGKRKKFPAQIKIKLHPNSVKRNK